MPDKRKALLARPRAIGLTMALSFVANLSAHATEMADLLGTWEQVTSNAGACPTCRVEFQNTPHGAIVVANNGWRADRLAPETGGPANGFGRWRDERAASRVSGRSFTVTCRSEESGLLAMTMTVNTGPGRQSVVRGSYRRAWQDM